MVDFPEFEYSEEEGRYVASHHPFTMPYPEDIPYLLSDPARVRAQAFDVVLNGVELGSGSIRIHQREIQQRMFEALGFSPEEIEARFGFMVNAFRYGTPPHGGFAFGLDRFVMLLLGEDSLREVIAFPKLRDASCPMTDAPGAVDQKQLDELKLTQSAAKVIRAKKPQAADKTLDVEKVAHLARLSLTEAEKTSMQMEMQSIVDFADRLASVDTSQVDAMTHVNGDKNVLRADEKADSLPRELALRAAAVQADGYICVPKTFE